MARKIQAKITKWCCRQQQTYSRPSLAGIWPWKIFPLSCRYCELCHPVGSACSVCGPFIVANVIQACKLPVYWKAPLFNLCHGVNKTVDISGFKKTWSRYWQWCYKLLECTIDRMVQGCHDTASRFVYMMTKGKRKYLLEEDFTELIQVTCCYERWPYCIFVLLGYYQ